MGQPPPRPDPPQPVRRSDLGPDRSDELKKEINAINDSMQKLSNIKDKINKAIQDKANNTKIYNNYIEIEIPKRISQYKKDKEDLMAIRDNAIATRDNIRTKYRNNKETIQRDISNNTLDIATINDIKKKIANVSYDNTYFLKSLAALTEQYFDAVHSENNMMDNNKKTTMDKYSADASKPVYINKSSNSLDTVNNIIFVVYYVLLFVLVYFLYNKEYPIFSKIILFIVLLLFPFYITDLQRNLKLAYNYLINP
jgi:hypothetical protein